MFLSVAVTLPRLKLIESGASLPPTGPVESQGFSLNKETPSGQKSLSRTVSRRGERLLRVQHSSHKGTEREGKKVLNYIRLVHPDSITN